MFSLRASVCFSFLEHIPSLRRLYSPAVFDPRQEETITHNVPDELSATLPLPNCGRVARDPGAMGKSRFTSRLPITNLRKPVSGHSRVTIFPYAILARRAHGDL